MDCMVVVPEEPVASRARRDWQQHYEGVFEEIIARVSNHLPQGACPERASPPHHLPRTTNSASSRTHTPHTHILVQVMGPRRCLVHDFAHSLPRYPLPPSLSPTPNALPPQRTTSLNSPLSPPLVRRAAPSPLVLRLQCTTPPPSFCSHTLPPAARERVLPLRRRLLLLLPQHDAPPPTP